MMALLQRVTRARVTVDGATTGEIGTGLLALVCAEQGDTEAEADKLLAKLLKLRIFADEGGRMNRSLHEVGGGLLVVSQFTLAADTSGGNRPSFANAAPADTGRALYEHFVARARAQHGEVATGRFGAMMQVELVNDGPVTIPLRIPPASAG
ncbi:D-tyrosyl-tRNA(Tyr) deacylase [Azoarcus olearius]|uniref:D-aminoacyl-tRNA deacylase n=1 Tax=Azoarcus sp. (strain BH72) TaxID=418699 RepID=UPI0008062903|nr:D-aminoacyl-tRNA deacylase [Azoarcus olearius]ANQ83202.1 D-tyrosyl-tRNA(Tyr) deacylase [Azoarcus olearius]